MISENVNHSIYRVMNISRLTITNNIKKKGKEKFISQNRAMFCDSGGLSFSEVPAWV